MISRYADCSAVRPVPRYIVLITVVAQCVEHKDVGGVDCASDSAGRVWWTRSLRVAGELGASKRSWSDDKESES